MYSLSSKYQFYNLLFDPTEAWTHDLRHLRTAHYNLSSNILFLHTKHIYTYNNDAPCDAKYNCIFITASQINVSP